MVRFGIVGIGNMGTSYCNWFTGGKITDGQLAAVCDVNPEKRQWAKENLPQDVAIFEKYEEMFDSGLIDAVMVVTPHYFHPGIAISALKHGFHVLVDKPAGVYASQIQEMNEEALRHPDQKFAMMFNQRTNPLYKRIKEIVANGEIGEIRKVNWMITSWWRTQKYYDSSAWRATWKGEGGGVLVNQAPHQLDLLQWICGLPCMVRGFLHYGSHRRITVEDDVTAYFEYPNGASGTFITCTHDAVGADRLDIEGNKGKIVIENSRDATIYRLTKPEEVYNEELSFREALAITKGEFNEKLYEKETFSYPEHWDIQHIDVLINFVRAIEHGEELIAPGTEGIRAVQLANAMYLSDWKREDVTLPVDPDEFYNALQAKIAEEEA